MRQMTRLLRIHGRVQGVCYRDGAVAEASRLGVSGWVRNRRDGTVEALISGEPENLLEFVTWARNGPPTAEVSMVEVQECVVDASLEGFSCWPTL
ncbi:acylphosphatase [Pseudogulbenkiania ferrooxidans]|uniref:acylphosphatase n=1 Tax=Pseudogulbenkiania ferrooxidans 2002 TaxID=279714 RepID=B9Z138_9NEIS|nr:acylphosphatase [Pseudogulbenkiania ferrooxidans]EEG09133.1 acylphosphatase [Pseudogulbenkiania ferrooxidans 2002]